MDLLAASDESSERKCRIGVKIYFSCGNDFFSEAVVDIQGGVSRN